MKRATMAQDQLLKRLRTGATSGPPQALIVDDDPSFRLWLGRRLEKLGFCPIARGSAADALRYATDNPLDLVCLDLMLPDRSGFSVCEDLRRLPNLGQVPILVVSARAGAEPRARAEQAGADGYLLKPIRPPELEREVRRLLGRAPQGSPAGTPAAAPTARSTGSSPGNSMASSPW